MNHANMGASTSNSEKKIAVMQVAEIVSARAPGLFGKSG
jgi:hypothetical protein